METLTKVETLNLIEKVLESQEFYLDGKKFTSTEDRVREFADRLKLAMSLKKAYKISESPLNGHLCILPVNYNKSKGLFFGTIEECRAYLSGLPLNNCEFNCMHCGDQLEDPSRGDFLSCDNCLRDNERSTTTPTEEAENPKSRRHF